MSRFGRNRDHYAGLLMALIGAGAIYKGVEYGVGGLTSMGSGFFPVVLGVGLVLMGAVMITTYFTEAFKMTLVFGVPFLAILTLAYWLFFRKSRAPAGALSKV